MIIADGGGLARAVAAKQRRDAAGRHAERNVADGGDPLERLAQPLDFDHWTRRRAAGLRRGDRHGVTPRAPPGRPAMPDVSELNLGRSARRLRVDTLGATALARGDWSDDGADRGALRVRLSPAARPVRAGHRGVRHPQCGAPSALRHQPPVRRTPGDGAACLRTCCSSPSCSISPAGSKTRSPCCSSRR